MTSECCSARRVDAINPSVEFRLTWRLVSTTTTTRKQQKNKINQYKVVVNNKSWQEVEQVTIENTID